MHIFVDNSGTWNSITTEIKFYNGFVLHLSLHGSRSRYIFIENKKIRPEPDAV